MRQVISVEEDGSIAMIYSDDLISLIKKGVARTIRASNVEPVGNKWSVDLTPIGGPAQPTLYTTRAEALEAEVKWIEMNKL